jgi:MFS family permease
MPSPSPSLFASRDYRLLLLGQTTSQLGAQVSGVAVPLLAVLVLHASPLQLGIVNAAGTVAFALIGLPVGAWTDRWLRRRILVASDLARALLLATVPIAWWLGWLTMTQLVIVSLLVGAARVFFDVAYQTYLPTVVGPGHVLGGNSAMEAIRATGQVAGPGLGGCLVGLLGAANVVTVQAGTFAASALSLLAIRRREEPLARHESPARLRHQIGEGLRFVLRNPILRATAVASAVGNFAFAIGSAVVVIFMARTLGLSAALMGDVMAAGALAALVGATVTPRLARRLGSARVVWLPLAVSGPVAVAGGLARPGWSSWLVVLGTVAGELGQIVYAISNVSLRQRLCPPELLGRVNATMRFLIMGLFPLGAVLGGALGEVIGPRATLLISFGLVALSPIPLYRTLRAARDVEDLPAWERSAALSFD